MVVVVVELGHVDERARAPERHVGDLHLCGRKEERKEKEKREGERERERERERKMERKRKREKKYRIKGKREGERPTEKTSLPTHPTSRGFLFPRYS